MVQVSLGRRHTDDREVCGARWDAMVDVAVDGVEACWLEADDKAAVRAQVAAARESLRPEAVL